MLFRLIKALWLYRGFISGSVKREFQSKYRNSLLGALWSIINPLAMISVYMLIFSQIMRAKWPGLDTQFAYSIYLCSGILTWGFFSEIISRAQNTFIENANLLKKQNFPRLCLPSVVVASASLNFSIIFSLFLLFLLFTGNFPGLVMVALIPMLLILVAFAVGVGVSLGVLNVFFRDVGSFFGLFLQFWFWLTPIVYTADMLPVQVQRLEWFNPMAPLMAGFQTVLVSGKWPAWQTLLFPAALAFFSCCMGIRLFRKHGADMVDEL